MYYVLRKEGKKFLVVSRHASMLKALEAENALKRKSKKCEVNLRTTVWASRKKYEVNQVVNELGK